MRIAIDMLCKEHEERNSHPIVENQQCREALSLLSDLEHNQPEGAVLPFVSIVIPASRLHHAQQALNALGRQRYRGQSEIIVVGPPAIQLASNWPIRIVHPEAVYPPGKARNLGAAQARGDILLFLDDDMLVEPDWIERNVCALQSPAIGAVGARMPGRSRTFYARCADFANYGYYQHTHVMDALLGAGSMGIRRTLFTQLAGFDEMLRAAEDIELCQRIQQHGYRTLYQPAIMVTHDHHYDTFARLLRYNYEHGFHGGWQTKMHLRRKGRWLCLMHNLTPLLLRYLPLFLALLPCIALLTTLRIIGLNMSSHRSVLLYAFHIYLGKLAYQFGVYRYLMQGER